MNTVTFKITVVFKKRDQDQLYVENFTKSFESMNRAIDSALKQLEQEIDTTINVLEVHAVKVRM